MGLQGVRHPRGAGHRPRIQLQEGNGPDPRSAQDAGRVDSLILTGRAQPRAGSTARRGSDRTEPANLLRRTDHGIVADHAYSVAPRPLRLVERTVRRGQEICDLTPAASVPRCTERGHTDGHSQSDVLSIWQIPRIQGRGCYVLTNPFCDAV